MNRRPVTGLEWSIVDDGKTVQINTHHGFLVDVGNPLVRLPATDDNVDLLRDMVQGFNTKRKLHELEKVR